MALPHRTQVIHSDSMRLKRSDLQDPAFREGLLRLAQVRVICEDHFCMKTFFDLLLAGSGQKRINQRIKSTRIYDAEKGRQRVSRFFHEHDYRAPSFYCFKKTAPHTPA